MKRSHSYSVVNGRVDFSTNEAVIEYNKAILKSIFGLDVEIPFGNLVPTIASR